MTSRPSIAPGWLTGVEPANTGATTRRSSNRASATPQRSNWSPASASSRLARATRARPLRQRAGPSLLEPSARIERATSALPMRRSASRTSTAHFTGADDGARTRTEPAYETGALPLAHRPHTPLAEPTGFEPAISCVTGRRGRPDSSMTPDWLRAHESNVPSSAYETDDQPLAQPATTSMKRCSARDRVADSRG